MRRQVEEIGDDFDPDGALADAIEAAGNVILPFSFIFRADDDPLRSRARAASRAVGSWAYQGTRLAESEEPRLPLRADDLFPPVNRIAKRALSGGHVNVGRESDGTTRYEYPVLAYQGKYYPSLSVQAARAFLGIAPGEVVVTLNKGLQLGPLWLPTDDRMRMVVNFYGVGGTIPIHSFTDVVNGKKAPSHFADKIVLIGANATGIKDEFITPFSPNLSGTERLGIVIDNILQQRFIARQSYYWFIDAAIAITGGLILGVAASRLSAFAFSFFTLALGVALIVGNQLAFAVYNLWLNVTLPAAALLIAYSSLSIYRYFVQERSAREIRSAFSHYIHPDMVRVLAADPERLVLGGEMRTMTLLFADIRGFTTIAEHFKSDPQGVTRLINRFLTPMTDIIMDRRGTIDKYMGDCIMAFWNAPLDDAEDAAHACDAALAMIRDLAVLNDALKREAEAEGRPFHVIEIGVGLNTGECCVGNLGSEQRFDYSVLGDAVNLASRLQGQCKAYGVDIVIGEETRSAAPDFATVELDRIAVSGKTEAVRAYALVGDESYKADPRFQDFLAVHNAMLAAYRSRDWARARNLIRECLRLNPDLRALYALYGARIAQFEEAPPPESWDGVFVAVAR